MSVLLRTQHSLHPFVHEVGTKILCGLSDAEKRSTLAQHSENGPTAAWQPESRRRGNFPSHKTFIKTLCRLKCHSLTGERDPTNSGMVSDKI